MGHADLSVHVCIQVIVGFAHGLAKGSCYYCGMRLSMDWPFSRAFSILITRFTPSTTACTSSTCHTKCTAMTACLNYSSTLCIPLICPGGPCWRCHTPLPQQQCPHHPSHASAAATSPIYLQNEGAGREGRVGLGLKHVARPSGSSESLATQLITLHY